jgi:hypothetical protein
MIGPARRRAWLAESAAVLPCRFRPVHFGAFLAAAFLLNYPGRLTPDALVQLIGAANPRLLDDWHSPLVGWLWNLPAPLLGQPAAALFVQSLPLAFFAAVGPAPFRWSARETMLFAAELLFKLSLVAWAGLIIKDVLLLGIVLALLACLRMSLSAARPRPWFAAAAGLLILVGLVRPTNFIMLTAAAALALPFFTGSRRRYFLGLAASLAAFGLLLPAYAGMTRTVFAAAARAPEKQLILFDLAGIASRSGRDLFADIPGWPADLARPQACYDPRSWVAFSPGFSCAAYSEAFDRAYARSGPLPLLSAWARGIARHPIAYLGHRLDFTAHILSGGYVPPAPIIRNRAWQAEDTALNSPGRARRFQAAIHGKVEPDHFRLWQDRQFLEPWAVLAYATLGLRFLVLLASCLCLALGAWLARRRCRGETWDPVAAIAVAMGLGNMLMSFLTGVAAGSRYSFPLLACTYVALFAVLRLAGSARRAAGEAG